MAPSSSSSAIVSAVSLTLRQLSRNRQTLSSSAGAQLSPWEIPSGFRQSLPSTSLLWSLSTPKSKETFDVQVRVRDVHVSAEGSERFHVETKIQGDRSSYLCASLVTDSVADTSSDNIRLWSTMLSSSEPQQELVSSSWSETTQANKYRVSLDKAEEGKVRVMVRNEGREKEESTTYTLENARDYGKINADVRNVVWEDPAIARQQESKGVFGGGNTVPPPRPGKTLVGFVYADDPDTTEVEGQTATVASSMNGKVVKLLVSNGARVKKGDSLVVLEAMKMETIVKSPTAGTVSRILVSAGSSVKLQQPLALISQVPTE